MMTRSILFAFAALSLAGTTLAQSDMNALIQEHMAKAGAPGGMHIEEDTDPYVPNAFTGSFTMEIHSYTDGVEDKQSPMNMHMASNEAMTMVRMENAAMKQDMRMLTDFKDKYQYMLMTDEKGNKTAMKMKKMKVNVDEAAIDKAPDLKVTGETKTIEGHLCEQVIATTEDGTWTAWVAKDIEAPYTDMMRHVSSPEGTNWNKKLAGMKGFPLEYEWVDAKEPKRMTSRIKDLKMGSVDAANFSLDGYQVMELPMMPFGR